MKLITAIIKPHKLDDVKEALKDAGVPGMTVDEVQGFGRQGGHTEIYRGSSTRSTSCPRCASRWWSTTPTSTGSSTLIVDAARTGKIGDGKVWVTDVSTAHPHPHRRAGRRRDLTPRWP